MFKIKGILFYIGPKQIFGSNMVKKEFVVSRIGGSAYPNLVFEILGNELIGKLEALPLNSLVEVTFDIHGKSYTPKDGDGTPKYFDVLRTFNIERVVEAPAVTVTTPTESGLTPVL